jgi:hypothetical protein
MPKQNRKGIFDVSIVLGLINQVKIVVITLTKEIEEIKEKKGS